MLRRVAVVLAAPLLLALPADGARAADPPVVFTNTGERCRNLLVSGNLDPQVAREVVPKRFDIGSEPTGFVELASCEGGSLDGEPLGAFRIAEAAVDIQAPAAVPSSTGTTGGHIYALTQLDTNPRLSQRKKDVGFTSELVDIRLQDTGPLATRLEATIPWATSPYTMAADLSPEGAPLPGVTIVTRIWGQGTLGVVVTHNDIRRIYSGSAGVGTATFQEGSLLARLFGTTRLTGQSISGIGDFVNQTYVIEPAPQAPVATPPSPSVLVARVTPGRRLLVRGTGALTATVRRGTRPRGGLVRTLSGTGRLTWDARDRRGRRVAPGTYTVRVRRASTARVVRTFRLTVGRRGVARLVNRS